MLVASVTLIVGNYTTSLPWKLDLEPSRIKIKKLKKNRPKTLGSGEAWLNEFLTGQSLSNNFKPKSQNFYILMFWIM